MPPSDVERTREEVRRRRRRDHLAQARRLRDCTPGETMEAAFDLARFAREIAQVGS